MKNNTTILKWSLLLGSIYFLSVAIVHMIGFKIPILFIYFDVPSYVYQDRIISFLAFGWSIFFFTAFTNPQQYAVLTKAILFSGAFAIVGLSVINLTTDFHKLSLGIIVGMFWIETFGLFIYWLWLFVFYFRSRNDWQKNNAA
jgi:hypothetical protein